LKTVLTIIIVILILRILVRYQQSMAKERIRQMERERYDRMQQQKHPHQEPKITVTRQPKNDSGDYIDYEEVK
jgi:uncharacterized membrane protein